MKRFFSAVTAACCAAIGAVLVINGKAAAQGAAEGISLCLNTVIPSLFCFMVLTGFLVQSGIYRLLSLPLAPVAKHLFFLPSDTASIILLSFVGGYPMSAKAISDLLACRRISFSCAQRMLCFCFCAGPSFIITAIGAGMFGSVSVGIFLYLTQVFISCLIGIVLGIYSRIHSHTLSLPVSSLTPVAAQPISYSRAFVNSVAQAVQTCGQMCGFVILFKAVSALLSPVLKNKNLSCLILGSLEVTNGCALGASLPFGVVFVSVFLSFGGFSVLAQIAGILKDSPLSVKPLFIARLFHALFSGLVSLFFLKRFPQVISVFGSISRPVPVSDSYTPVFSFCFIMMSILLLKELYPLRFALPVFSKKQNRKKDF